MKVEKTHVPLQPDYGALAETELALGNKAWGGAPNQGLEKRGFQRLGKVADTELAGRRVESVRGSNVEEDSRLVATMYPPE